MNENVIVSIIIPTYNRKTVLIKCLSALFAQSYSKDKYEIIVVDDGSSDNTEELVIELMKNAPCTLRYLKQTKKGPAGVRNIGIKDAKGKHILLIGDDIIASKTLLEEHMKIHELKKDIAVLGYTLWHSDIEITEFMNFLAPNGPQFNYKVIKDTENCSYKFFYTSNISLEKKWFDDNIFDEDFKYAAFEDIELGYRLEKKGLKILFNKNAIAYHHHRYEPKQFFDRQQIAGKSALILFKKHIELKSELLSSKKKMKVKLLNFMLFLPFLEKTFLKKIYWKQLSNYWYLKGMKNDNNN